MLVNHFLMIDATTLHFVVVRLRLGVGLMLCFDSVLLLEGLEFVLHPRKVIRLPDSALALLVWLRRYPLLLQFLLDNRQRRRLPALQIFRVVAPIVVVVRLEGGPLRRIKIDVLLFSVLPLDADDFSAHLLLVRVYLEVLPAARLPLARDRFVRLISFG